MFMQQDNQLSQCIQFCNQFQMLKILTSSTYPIVSNQQRSRSRTPKKKVERPNKHNAGKKFENVKKVNKNNNTVDYSARQDFKKYKQPNRNQIPQHSSLKGIIDQLAFGSKSNNYQTNHHLIKPTDYKVPMNFMENTAKFTSFTSKYEIEKPYIFTNEQHTPRNSNYITPYYEKEVFNGSKTSRDCFNNSSQGTFYNEETTRKFDYNPKQKWNYQSPRRNLIYVPVSRSPSPLGNSSSCMNLNVQRNKSPRQNRKNQVERPFYEPKVSPLKAMNRENERQPSPRSMVQFNSNSNTMNQLQMEMISQLKNTERKRSPEQEFSGVSLPTRSATQTFHKQKYHTAVNLEDGLSESISHISTDARTITIDIKNKK